MLVLLLHQNELDEKINRKSTYKNIKMTLRMNPSLASSLLSRCFLVNNDSHEIHTHLLASSICV